MLKSQRKECGQTRFHFFCQINLCFFQENACEVSSEKKFKTCSLNMFPYVFFFLEQKVIWKLFFLWLEGEPSPSKILGCLWILVSITIITTPQFLSHDHNHISIFESRSQSQSLWQTQSQSQSQSLGKSSIKLQSQSRVKSSVTVTITITSFVLS